MMPSRFFIGLLLATVGGCSNSVDGSTDRTDGGPPSGDGAGAAATSSDGLGDRYLASLQRYNDLVCDCLPNAVGCDPDGDNDAGKDCLREEINAGAAEWGESLDCEIINLGARADCLSGVTDCDEAASIACEEMNEPDCPEPPAGVMDQLLRQCTS